MSASPAPANADFAERLQRIRDCQGHGARMAQSEHAVPQQRAARISRLHELAQNFRYAVSGFGIVAAGAVGLLLYTQSADPQADTAQTCPPAPAEASAAAPVKAIAQGFGAHKTANRKVLHPVAAAAADGC